jgi:hypothetical protein
MNIETFDTLDSLMERYEKLISESDVASAYVGIYTTANEPIKIKHSSKRIIDFLLRGYRLIGDEPNTYKTAKQVLKDGHFEKGENTDNRSLTEIENPVNQIYEILNEYNLQLKNNSEIAFALNLNYKKERTGNNKKSILLSLKGKPEVNKYQDTIPFIEKIIGVYEQQNFESFTINGNRFEKDDPAKAFEYITKNNNKILIASFAKNDGSTNLVYIPK